MKKVPTCLFEMPRLWNNEESEARRQRVLARAARGDAIKAIAADEGLKEMAVRNQLWAEGWRSMHLNSVEQQIILKRRTQFRKTP